MPSSHIRSSKPSALLALLGLTFASRSCSDWVAVPLREAARTEGLNPERISRLATRALGSFEQLVDEMTRVGRPGSNKRDEQSEELALTRSLLSVATSLLGEVRLRKAATRVQIVGAYERLRKEHPTLTHKRFCQALSLPQRTLRSWRSNPKMSDKRSSPPIDNKPQKPRPPRRGRFGFAFTLPGVQVAADTTDLRAFGIPLKLIATQDVGGRDQSLLDSVIVDDHESAELVVAVLKESLAERPGAQLISDQGTPYLAEATRKAIEELEAEHAIQKEGDPLGKATIERAFGMFKWIASPILAITDRIATAVESLAQAEFAIAFVRLLLTALLRAYQAGARASHRASNERAVAPDDLERVAEMSRERARAEFMSARLSIERIHRDYDIGCSLKDFKRSCRRFPVPVLRCAERMFAKQAHRDDIRNRAAYFLFLANEANKQHRRERARITREREQAREIREHERRVAAERSQWHAEPATWLQDILELLVHSWTGTELLTGGHGLRAWLGQACARLFEVHGPMAHDVVAGLLRNLEQTHLAKLGPTGVTAIKAVLQPHLEDIPKPATKPSGVGDFVATILRSGSTMRPPPSSHPC